MSVSREDVTQFFSPPLQSAQQPADRLYAENEDFDLASDNLSDAPSDVKSGSQQSSERESSDPAARQSITADGHVGLDVDSQDSTTLPSRPNKFNGPQSTWRNWIAPERDLAVSLGQLQAKDLSVHLYNSFKLRQRNSTWDPDQRAQISKDLGEANEVSKWVPPKVWTAWPLPPGIVPRERDETRWEDDTITHVPYRSSPERPGRHLQEMLVAQVLRKAKEQFHNRQWEVEPPSATTSPLQRQQSQSRGRDSSGKFSTNEDQEITDQKPVVMADDQRASQILQASVQHMMTKLDDLLMGLHHARSAYLLIEDSDTESQSQTSERSTSRSKPRKRKREASTPVEGSHEMSDDSDSDSNESRPRRKKSDSKGKTKSARSSSRRSRSQIFRGRKGRLGLRDWSDVLGIASMTGWHQNVVGGTAARCATLFGEGVKFRTLEEGKKVQEEHSYLPGAAYPVTGGQSQGTTWRARESSSNRFENGMVGGVHIDGFLEPIEGKKSWRYTNGKQSKQKKPSRKSKI